MRHKILALAVVLSLALPGCATPTPTRARPTPTLRAQLSSQAAMALVLERLPPGQRPLIAPGLSAKYSGKGVWQVSYRYSYEGTAFTAGWEVHERTNQALPVNDSARFIEAVATRFGK